MKTRIVRMFCESKCRDVWVVQQWTASPTEIRAAPWESVRDFEIDDYDMATALAMDLSLTKKTPIEMAVFDDGVCVTPTTSVDSAQNTVSHP